MVTNLALLDELMRSGSSGHVTLGLFAHSLEDEAGLHH